MGYYVTDTPCLKCGKTTYNKYSNGLDDSAKSYMDWYKCPLCGHNPDKDKDVNADN